MSKNDNNNASFFTPPNSVVHDENGRIIVPSSIAGDVSEEGSSYLTASSKDETHNFQFVGKASDNYLEIWRCNKRHIMGSYEENS
jgi:hypothetical protein